MRIVQKPISKDTSSSILSVNTDTFAELKNYRPSSSTLEFDITFNLSLSNKKKRVEEYDKVVITVSRKESEVAAAANRHSSVQAENKGRKVNQTDPDPIKSLRPVNSRLPMTRLPPKVAEKLYSGLQVVKDLMKKEEFLVQSTVLISPFVVEAKSNSYSFTELYAEAFKENKKSQKTLSVTQSQSNGTPTYFYTSLGVDPKDTIERINSDLTDITAPTSDFMTSRMSSLNDFGNQGVKNDLLKRGLNPFIYDLTKYYLETVPNSPMEGRMKMYSKRQVTKTLDAIDITSKISLMKNNKSHNLVVRFDLYKRGTNVVDETFSTDLFVPNHIEAAESITHPPEVTLNRKAQMTTSSSRSSFGLNINNDRDYTLKIKDKDQRPGRVKSYNIYLKNITSTGETSFYRFVGNVLNRSGECNFSFTTITNLSVIRVVPVDFRNKESNLFTNVVVGPGYPAIGRLTILPSPHDISNVKIDILNVPKDATNLTLYAKDCTDNVDKSFEIVSSAKIPLGVGGASLVHRQAMIGRTYEYYIIASTISQKTRKETPVYSNFVLYRNSVRADANNSISVMLQSPASSLSAQGDATTQFSISTVVSPTESQRITETLKTNYAELYSLFLDPANNSGSPVLGDDVPQYTDLFMHEITRTNLNTGERETFNMVPDGTFYDNRDSQIQSNVKPINIQHAYFYQIYTYKKNPIEFFKGYVARGVDSKGKEWFYSPYKWKNTQSKLGKLYPDNQKGETVIPLYENVTSESFGVTASHQTDGSAKYVEISEVIVDRIDRNTVKVYWDYQELGEKVPVQLYDSFIVLKEVNGVRKFVGRTRENYIYHELTEDDLGTVYYIVVPIMSEFDIDTPGYSNSIFIGPEGLTPKNRVINKLPTPLDTAQKAKSLSINKSEITKAKNYSSLFKLK